MNDKEIQLSPEEIEANFKRFCGYIDRLDERSPNARELVDALGERLALCPASSRVEHHSCYPGGLVVHSLNVLSMAVNIRKMLSAQDVVQTSSLVLVCLFHDLGKVGDLIDDYYVPQTSDWHYEKLGERYTTNKNIMHMTVPHRSVWLCNRFGLQLTQDEIVAILIHDGPYEEEHKKYGMRAPALACIVHWADIMATMVEKGLFNARDDR